jgi:hypothetical protein
MSEESAVEQTRRQIKRMSTPGERQEWLRRYGESGLSIREFCEKNKLVLNTFYQWRSKSQLVRASAEVVTNSEPAFAEIKLEGLNTACNWVAELRRPNGVILRVGANLPGVLLEQLLRIC